MPLVGLAGLAGAANDGVEPVTPYRPSVSSLAQLPAARQLKFEFGGLRQSSTDMRRSGVPYLFKLAFDKEWGVLIGGEAHVWQRDAGEREQGLGDTTLTLERAWVIDEASALGKELGVKLPTAKVAIGSGKADYAVNAIYSRDLGPVRIDTNLNALRLGVVDADSSRTQWGVSTSISTPLSAHWSVTGELSGTRRSGAGHGSQLLAALSYGPNKLPTIDIGIARATRPTPATTSLFAGVVLPLAKLW